MAVSIIKRTVKSSNNCYEEKITGCISPLGDSNSPQVCSLGLPLQQTPLARNVATQQEATPVHLCSSTYGHVSKFSPVEHEK